MKQAPCLFPHLPPLLLLSHSTLFPYHTPHLATPSSLSSSTCSPSPSSTTDPSTLPPAHASNAHTFRPFRAGQRQVALITSRPSSHLQHDRAQDLRTMNTRSRSAELQKPSGLSANENIRAHQFARITKAERRRRSLIDWSVTYNDF